MAALRHLKFPAKIFLIFDLKTHEMRLRKQQKQQCYLQWRKKYDKWSLPTPFLLFEYLFV